MSYTPPPSSPYEQPAGAPAKGGRPVLLIIGGAVLLLSLLLCGIGGFRMVGGMQGLAEEPERTGSHTITAAEGDTISVWAEPDAAISCTVDGPSGPLADESSASMSSTVGDRELERVMAVNATEAGDYTVSCNEPFVVATNVSMSGLWIASVGGALCCLGSVLAIVGLIVWLSRRKK